MLLNLVKNVSYFLFTVSFIGYSIVAETITQIMVVAVSPYFYFQCK